MALDTGIHAGWDRVMYNDEHFGVGMQRAAGDYPTPHNHTASLSSNTT
jgi:hypothetical protein